MSFADDWKAAEAAAAATETKGGAAPAEAAKEEPAAIDSKTESVEPPKEAPAEETAAEPSAEKTTEEKELEAKAKDGTISKEETREFVKLREERRRVRAQLEHEKKVAWEQLQAHASKLDAEYGGLVKAKKALDANDPDGLASALGYKDWSDLQTHILKTSAAPGYRELRQLRKELDEKNEREARAEQERRRELEQRQAQERYQAQVLSVRSALTKAGGLAAEFAVDDPFLDMVVAEKRKAFEEGDEDVTDLDAANRALQSIAEMHERVLSRLEKHQDHEASKRVLSRRQTQNAALRSPERSNPEKGKKNNVSHTRPAEAGGARPMTDKEQLQQLLRDMANADP